MFIVSSDIDIKVLGFIHCSVVTLDILVKVRYSPKKPTLHSDKFKMNEEVNSFLSEKVSNLLLT